MPVPPVSSSPGVTPAELDHITLQIEELRERVLQLEVRLGITFGPAEPAIPASPVPVDFDVPSNIVPVLGRMVVVIAGAYVLRALTDWGLLPAAAGVAIGLLYALIWLFVAARSPAGSNLPAALNCSTSVLIMAPLVWEATGRLKVMSSWTSAAVLAAFALIALALGSGTTHRIIATIGGVASIAMALALLLVRNDIVPFTTALLVIAAAMEFAAWRDFRSSVRVFAALAADLSVVLLCYLMSSPGGAPETWIHVSGPAALTAPLALALIFIVSALTQTVARRRTLNLSETVQTSAALLIGIGGAVWVFKDHRPIMVGLGIASLAAGLALYAVSFLLFERDNKWNFRALASFGLFLVLAGIFLPFSRAGFWILACVCAAACCWAARAFVLPTLGLHGAIYLSLGSAIAGATRQALPFFFTFGQGAVAWPASVAVLLAAAVCWIAIQGISAGSPNQWRNQTSSLALAAHIVWITQGLAVYAILAVWRKGSIQYTASDTLATIVLTALSLALAWTGRRWNRRELVWLVYGFVALGGYKLVTRDLINEHNLPLILSLLCYGGALIILPRILRGRPRQM
jgi:hypothetical protein